MRIQSGPTAELVETHPLLPGKTVVKLLGQFGLKQGVHFNYRPENLDPFTVLTRDATIPRSSVFSKLVDDTKNESDLVLQFLANGLSSRPPRVSGLLNHIRDTYNKSTCCRFALIVSIPVHSRAEKRWRIMYACCRLASCFRANSASLSRQIPLETTQTGH